MCVCVCACACVCVELAWHSGSVMDCHATALGSIQETVNWGAVSK